jgi:hypothetical protein
MREKLFSFWSGDISYVERLCIASMSKAGHLLDIYTYDDDLNVPTGVTVRAASEIIDEKYVIRHENGSLALFSDIFRYAGLQKNAGIWVDLDVLLLHPLDGLGEYIFCRQDDYTVNGAILKLPSDSIVLQSLLELARARVVVAPYWRRRDKLKQMARGLIGRAVPISRLEWGIIGPNALTHFIKISGLDSKILPQKVFYPIPHPQAANFFDCDASKIEMELAPNTLAVHVWNDLIKEFKKNPPPAGSFIDKQCRHFAVETGIKQHQSRLPRAVGDLVVRATSEG